VAAITRILATYPALPFVLIGDSGQEDPEIYCEIVRSYPGRILAVYIRNVTPTLAQRTAAVQALALAAARHACAHGLISSTDLAAVAAAVSAG
jgi:phosphatidate phosphatase APP1